MTSRLSRIISWLIALAVGAVYGAAGSLAHASMIGIVPVGLILGLLGATGLLLALRLLTGDRWAALAGGLGIVLATYVFTLPTAGGSLLFTELNEIAALTWMAGPPLIAAIIVAWPDLRRVGRASGSPN